jgi:predicted metalloprotease with PDZ domain
MKLSFFVLIIFLSLNFCTTLRAQTGTYKYSINLNEVIDDQLKVELKVPAGIQSEEVYFYFPRIVPGTYQIHDFGQLVKDFKAFDIKGNSLYVDRVDETTWRITKAKKLDKIIYTVDDTWDTRLKEPVFEAAGTSFDEGKSFLLNAQGLFGFFKNGLTLPVELSVAYPTSMYGASSLKRTASESGRDNFRAANYHDLIDRPLMYAVPDTVNFKLGYGDIQIAVYSPNKKVKASEIKDKILPILEAQNKYLGSILPVDHYNFLIYLSPNGFPSGNKNALEHHHSSLFCLDEDNIEKLSSVIVELAAHEFFHIVTPLHIKSEEIQNFDYLEPKMSRHLWLYEGVVEYMSFHMQVRTGLMTEQELLDKLSEKMRTSRYYKQGISLAEMSNYCLIEPYSSLYNNFYHRGALTAMCLDLALLSHSNGKYDLQALLRDLSSHFGKEQCFKDDELYEKIIEVTRQVDLLVFFSSYTEGTEMLNFNKYLEPFGIKFSETDIVPEISPMGGIEKGVLRTDSLGRMYIHKEDKLDEFGQKFIQFKKGDVILEWNGSPVNKDNISVVLAAYTKSVREFDDLSIKVLRKSANGISEEKMLNTKISRIMLPTEDVFGFISNASEEQKNLRKIWLGPIDKN